MALPGITFDLQGHRGARGLVPENSWPGFAEALAIGVTTLELDIVLTSDQVPVVYHDLGIIPERTRDRAGEWVTAPGPVVRELSLAELQTYDIGRLKPGSRTAKRFSEQRGMDHVVIPTFASIVERVEGRAPPVRGGGIRYNVELKVSPTDQRSPDHGAMVDGVLSVIYDSGIAWRTTIQSFDWQILELVRERAPKIARSYLSCEQGGGDTVLRGKPGPSPWLAGHDVDQGGSVPALVDALGGVMWAPCHQDVGPQALEEAHRLGLAVVVWTVNDRKDMEKMIDIGVDGIITDYPDRLRAVMIRRGMQVPKAYPRGRSPNP